MYIDMLETNYKIIFDMDGVIFDTERFYLACCVPAAEQCGLSGMEEVAFQCIGLTEEATGQKLLEAYGPDAPLEEFYNAMIKEFKRLYNEEGLPVKTGAREILSWLDENRITTALASSTRTEIVKTELADAGLAQFFDVIVGGDMAGKSKPAPDIFLKAAELLGCDPSECIVIEDSFNGIRAAHAAGMKPIMVPDLLMPDEEIRSLTIGVKDSLLEVLEYFRETLYKENNQS